MAAPIVLGITIRANGSAQVVGELNRVRDSVRGAGTAAQGSNRQFAAMARETFGLGSALTGLASGLSALALLQSAKQVMMLADTMKLVDSRIKVATSSSQDYLNAQKELVAISLRTGTAFEANATIFARTNRAIEQMGGSVRDTTAFTETLAQALGISGAATSEASAVIRQMSQALASGVLRGDEFNSMMENSPRLAQALAAGLNINIGALRKMAEAGELTSGKVISAIMSQSAVIDTEFKKIPLTVGKAMENVSTVFGQYILAADAGSGATAGLSGSVNALARNLTPIIDGIVTLGKIAVMVFAGQMVASLTAYITAKTSAMALEIAHAAAITMDLQRTLAMAEAQLAATSATVAATEATLLNTTAMGARMAIGNQLNLVLVQQATAQAAVVAAQTAASASTMTLAASLRLLLNPLNLLNVWLSALVGWVIGKFLNSFALVRIAATTALGVVLQVVEQLTYSWKVLVAVSTGSMAELGGLKTAHEAQAKAIEDNIQSTIDWEESQKNAASATVQQTQALTTFSTSQDAAATSSKAAKKAIAKGMSDEERAAKSLQSAYESQVESLLRNLALSGDSSATAAMEYDVANGALKNLTESQKLYLLQKTAELENNKLDAKASEAAKTELDGLIDKYNQLTLSARDYYQLTLVNKGISPANQATDMAQFDKNAVVEASQKSIADAKQALDSYIASLDSAAASTTNLGDVTSAVFDSSLGGINTLIGAFKATSKQLDDNTSKLATNAQQQLLNNKLAYGPEKIANTRKLYSEQTRLEQQNTALQLAGIRQVAGSAAQMYEEGSTARRVLHGIEMVAGIAELAQQISLMTVKGANAVLNQGQGDPYTAFARIAAMIATVAGIIAAAGGAFGASAGTAPPVPRGDTGTGTVLGDATAPSESIDKTYRLLQDIHAREYKELRGINRGVSELAAAITDTITQLFQGGGLIDPAFSATSKVNYPLAMIDPVASIDPITKFLVKTLFGSTKKEIVGGGLVTAPIDIKEILKDAFVGIAQYTTIQTTKTGGLFGKDKTSFGTELSLVDGDVQIALTHVFKSMAETMISLGDALGGDLTDRVRDYVIPSMMVELRGLSGEEASKKLNGVISAALDTMATAVFGDIIGQYQKLGEGMLETAVRIISEVAVVRDALATSGLSLADNAIAISDAVVQAAGGLKEFQTQFEDFYDKFYTDAEKQTRLTARLKSRVDEIFTPETVTILGAARSGYRQVLEALDLSNEADRERYSLLLELSGAADTYYTGLETAQKAAAEVADAAAAEVADAAAEVADAAAATAKELQALLDGLKAQTTDVKDILIAKYSDLLNRARELGANLGQMLQIYEAGLSEATTTINTSLTELLKTFTTFEKNLQTSRAGIAANITKLGGAASGNDPAYSQGIIDKLYQQLAKTTVNADKIGIINEINAAVMDRYDAELEMLGKVGDSVKQIGDYLNNLKLSDKSPLTNAGKLSEAQAQWSTQLALAKAGDKDALAAITGSADAYLTQARTFYASSSDYTAIFGNVTKSLESLSKPAGMDDATYKAATLDLQTGAITELQSLDKTLQRIYLDEKAVYAGQNAKLVASLANLGAIVATETGRLLAPMNAMLAWAQASLGRSLSGTETDWVRTQYYNNVPETAIRQTAQPYIDEQNRLAALQRAIQTAIIDATGALGRALTSVESDWIGAQFSSGRAKQSIYDEAIQYINQQKLNGSHAGGLEFVPFDGYRAELHRGERVLTSSQARRQDGEASQEIVAELKALRLEVERLRTEQREHTGAVIQSNYDANDRASDKVVAGGREASKEAAWAVRSKAVIS